MNESPFPEGWTEQDEKDLKVAVDSLVSDGLILKHSDKVDEFGEPEFEITQAGRIKGLALFRQELVTGIPIPNRTADSILVNLLYPQGVR